MPQEWLPFVIASFAIAIVPGPDILYVVGRGLAQGRDAAIVSAIALNVGAAIHAGMAALGLSAVIRRSELLFTLVQYAGGAYLAYLALSILFEREAGLAPELWSRTRLSRIFLQGVVTDLLNPKVYLFFLAFLPQFIDPSADDVPVQIAILGALFVLVNLPVDLAIAWGSGSFGGMLRESRTLATVLRWISATVLLGLAARVALGSGSTESTAEHPARHPRT